MTEEEKQQKEEDQSTQKKQTDKKTTPSAPQDQPKKESEKKPDALENKQEPKEKQPQKAPAPESEQTNTEHPEKPPASDTSDQKETKTEQKPTEEKDTVSEKQLKPAKEEKPAQKEKQQKTEKQGKQEKAKDDDFRYIVRIADTDIDGEKRLIYGLSQIKGIGRHLAFLISKKSGIKATTKMGDLTDKQIDAISNLLSDIPALAPSWMLNHQKDMETGNDIHLISAQVSLRLRDDINMLKMIRSYRGIRHEHNLPVRGQRTRGNNRRGLALGVSRKRV